MSIILTDEDFVVKCPKCGHITSNGELTNYNKNTMKVSYYWDKCPKCYNTINFKLGQETEPTLNELYNFFKANEQINNQ